MQVGESGAVQVGVAVGGVANAVVFWHEMELDAAASIDAAPGSHSRQACLPL